MVGNLVAGKRIAQAAGRDLGQIEENDLVRKVSVPEMLTFIDKSRTEPRLQITGSEKSGNLEVGGASRDSTGIGALEEGLISR